MAREPSYPDDHPVGAAKSARSGAEAAAEESRRRKQLVKGAAIGIGSAAVVAALLYANRKGRGERGGNG